MKKISIGLRIAELRKESSMTQGELAEKLGVSPQAVSKWENDVAYPDITLLSQLAKELGTRVDHLLNGVEEPETRYLAKKERKNIDDMILKIRVIDGGDKVKVNLPMPMLNAMLKMGMDNVELGGKAKSIKDIDFEELKLLIENGAVGKLVEIESEDGALVEIYVE